ncbi:MAG: hypothetical protein C0582_02870, partial [Alphaproteobacteria bacterium]
MQTRLYEKRPGYCPKPSQQRRGVPIVLSTLKPKIDHMPESITLSCEMFIKQRPIHINLEAITDTHSA